MRSQSNKHMINSKQTSYTFHKNIQVLVFILYEPILTMNCTKYRYSEDLNSRTSISTSTTLILFVTPPKTNAIQSLTVDTQSLVSKRNPYL